MIWLIGNKGMLGSEVESLLSGSGREFIVSDKEIDITDRERLSDFTHDKKISWIVNCSAYTAVDRAEDEPDSAYAINERGVGNIAHMAAQKKARLIHVSTDYVFDGFKSMPYEEDDLPNPQGIYGKSKLEGERKIRQFLAEHFIVRTAWLYGKNGPNFVHTMLRLFGERDEVRVVDDQWGSPTCAPDLAQALMKIISDESRNYGVYHYTNEGKASWYEFAVEIYRLVRLHKLIERNVKITPIPTDQYPTRAARPKNSLLSKEKIKKELGVECREWKVALEEYLTKDWPRMHADTDDRLWMMEE